MKKAEIRATLNMANEGHRLILTHYWVRGVYLVRITDAAGKRYPGGYVVVEDDMTNPEADRKKINWIIRLRDKVEELQAPAYPDDADTPEKQFEDQAGDYDLDSLKTPDLDLDDLKLPTAEDLLDALAGDPLLKLRSLGSTPAGVLLRRKAGWPDFLEDDEGDDDNDGEDTDTTLSARKRKKPGAAGKHHK